MIHEEGMPAPAEREIKRVEQIVRTIKVKKIDREEIYHLGAKVEPDGDTLRVDFGNESD